MNAKIDADLRQYAGRVSRSTVVSGKAVLARSLNEDDRRTLGRKGIVTRSTGRTVIRWQGRISSLDGFASLAWVRRIQGSGNYRL